MTKQPFAKRIVIAFVLMTALVSGLFSLSIVVIVHQIEEHLITEDMDHELISVLSNDLKYGRSPRLDSRTRFYASNIPEYTIPAEFRSADEGFTEISRGEDLYLYSRHIGGHHYVLVQEQHEFEAREKALFNVVLAGFLLSVVLSLGIGWSIARAIMSPVRELAQQVRERESDSSPLPPMAPAYANDEIGQLAEAFDSTFGQLHQALERERLFTGDVSHELRTPLMVIGSSCELLEEMELNPAQNKLVARITRASTEMRELVQTFLALARNRSDSDWNGDTATLKEIADRQVQQWSPLLQTKGLEFRFVEQAQDDGRYHPVLLATVMSNLLRNALHYTEQGYVSLVLEHNGFRIEDTGAGVAPEQQDDIFKAYFRGDSARGEGLGLGLSLVKRICSGAGWTIQVISLQPQGTCFHIRFNTVT